ncbi:protein-disulfide reductase DsbD family protein [Enterobacter cloacae complex sp. 2024EL-00232]|uniref:protein-disulfide reductase DsbD family protein n=1 Tax=Enterobacter TaxID=547 RepID=UPI001E5D4AE4|nr:MULTISPECIES: thioredoxin family protein [Enterobacter cloacae complex]HDT2077469.1 thioredoxin family protein [Enterobacter roggenkampii]HEG2000049.1 thioredoxin family protein [Enterobacter asburiae]MCD2460970.1 thioredoxin family protein [Enterobacter cloacae complex sp. 2021EL-01261]MDT9873545.1 thioredoxin family protein [Enterobacter cloacae]HDT2097730.1 thioredoxin family protein [Enterobacter roggenkampii]
MLTAMLAAFVGGIILNFMPCVFPVISLKALGILRHQGDTRSARTEGIGFLLGVIFTMLVLAGVLLALRAGGMAVGWGFQLQSPLVIAALALVILGASLNLLGVFEVGLSLQRAGEISVGRGAFTRSALTGALAIVVATPCSAPFMAGAVGYALVQTPAVSLGIFLALALGFAAPFTLISLFPAIAERLPRPGAWMDILKRGLAFPMLGAFAWLVWVLTQQAGTTALAALLASAVVVSFAAWLYGMAQRRRYTGHPYKVLLAVTAVLLIAAIGPLPGVMHTQSSQPEVLSAENITRVTWSPQTVEKMRGHGKAIFVDFTASWCITCQVNERTSLSTAAVKQALAETGTVYMVADSTRFNADIDDAMNTFGQGGLPLYVVYPADGSAPKVLPQVLTPSIVVNALNQASGKKA